MATLHLFPSPMEINSGSFPGAVHLEHDSCRLFLSSSDYILSDWVLFWWKLCVRPRLEVLGIELVLPIMVMLCTYASIFATKEGLDAGGLFWSWVSRSVAPASALDFGRVLGLFREWDCPDLSLLPFLVGSLLRFSLFFCRSRYPSSIWSRLRAIKVGCGLWRVSLCRKSLWLCGGLC